MPPPSRATKTHAIPYLASTVKKLKDQSARKTLSRIGKPVVWSVAAQSFCSSFYGGNARPPLPRGAELRKSVRVMKRSLLPLFLALAIGSTQLLLAVPADAAPKKKSGSTSGTKRAAAVHDPDDDDGPRCASSGRCQPPPAGTRPVRAGLRRAHRQGPLREERRFPPPHRQHAKAAYRPDRRGERTDSTKAWR